MKYNPIPPARTLWFCDKSLSTAIQEENMHNQDLGIAHISVAY